ncbi:MAG: hypothetical protein ABI867_00505 [Kofleriaceae bacterium]
MRSTRCAARIGARPRTVSPGARLARTIRVHDLEIVGRVALVYLACMVLLVRDGKVDSYHERRPPHHAASARLALHRSGAATSRPMAK